MKAHDIQLFVSDVDGTLLNGKKELTPATAEAIGRLQSAGIAVSLISARPPRGLQQLIETLKIKAACAALNGAVIVDAELRVISEHPIPTEAIRDITSTLQEHDLGIWIYTRADWYVSRLDAAHVRREIEAVRFSPLLFTALDEVQDPIVKILAVGDDSGAMARCEQALQQRVGKRLSISRSLENRLEITQCDANKGTAIEAICHAMDISQSHIATAGDGENDILMFRRSAFSIAMAQAPVEVRRAASETTSSNAHDGLAWAIYEFILGRT